jgi:hypothetical protein
MMTGQQVSMPIGIAIVVTILAGNTGWASYRLA